jgi:hypothetical protein
MTAPAEALEQLADPPIEEVVCGVAFTPLPQLDMLLLGSYWKRREKDFPHRELRSAVQSAPAGWSFAPLRALLVSADDESVLQIQPDRFFFNWRRRGGGAYPRFNSRGERPGVLARATDEFERLSAFCAEEAGGEPVVTGIELAKVDVFKEGRYWNGLADLVEMLPWLSDFAALATSGAPTFLVRFDEHRSLGTLTTGLSLATDSANASATRFLRIETRLVLNEPGTSPDRRQALFVEANKELNHVFATLIPRTQRDKRFNREVR